MMHGIAGGIMDKLQGGKFGHGFASAGANQLLGPAINKVDSKKEGFSNAHVAVAAIVAGTVSASTGGKFANGALTSAFSLGFGEVSGVALGPRSPDDVSDAELQFGFPVRT